MTGNFSRSEQRVFETTLFALGALLTLWFFVSLKLHFDNLQILEKAFRLIDLGQWTHYGNAGSHVGYTPGTFLTAITALPMMLVFSPYSAMAVIGLFHVVALLILLGVARPLGSQRMTVLVLLLFWLNPWRVEQAELYNPGYLFLFAALHLWTSLRMQLSRHFGLTLLHVLTLGFCAQIHFSVLILAILSLLLWWRRDLKVHWGGFALGAFLVALSLLPYALTVLESPQVGVSVPGSENAFLGRNAVLVYPVLKALLYWFRYGSMYYGRHIFSEIEFSWITSDFWRDVVSVSYHFLKWPLALGTLALSIYLMFPLLKSLPRTLNDLRFPRRERDLENSAAAARGWNVPPDSPALPFLNYLRWLFVAMLLSAGLSPVEFNHWHLILCFPAVSLMLALNLDRWLAKRSRGQEQLVLIALTLIFCVHNSFAALGSRSHSWRYDFHHDVMKYYKQTHPR